MAALEKKDASPDRRPRRDLSEQDERLREISARLERLRGEFEDLNKRKLRPK